MKGSTNTHACLCDRTYHTGVRSAGVTCGMIMALQRTFRVTAGPRRTTQVSPTPQSGQPGFLAANATDPPTPSAPTSRSGRDSARHTGIANRL